MMQSERAKTQVISLDKSNLSTGRVKRLFKQMLMCGSIGLLSLLSQGCSSNNQFTGGSAGLLKSFSLNRTTTSSGNQQVATANQPVTSTTGRPQASTNRSQIAANQSGSIRPSARPLAQTQANPVTPVSYNAVSVNETTTVDGDAASSKTPAQLAGIRRQAFNTNQADSVCNPGCAMPSEGCATCAPQRWDIDPQEFICDGGDRDPATIVREDWSAAGVDTTDTVMYYETLGGQVCVRPSNRTCVYAPRFGAVRQVTGAALAANALAPGRVHGPQSAVGMLDRNKAGNLELAAKPIGQKQVQMLDRLNDQQRLVPIDMIQPPTPIGTVVSPKINVDRTAVDEALGREWLELLDGRIEVVTLINPESLNVILSDQSAHFVSSSKQAAEVFLYETPDKCSMRITKTASHQMASPGDRIRFTIRFENMGSQKLGNAVILDSLSPRLSYVEGSQQCSVEADFSSQPNEAGSSVLRWSITNPIEGQKGGVISFDCEVR